MAQKTESFLTRILQLFFPRDDAEAIKKRHLKTLAKEISKSKFGKWYKPSSEELQQQMARFFFELYKIVGPARALLASAASSKVLKSITVEQNLSKHQHQLREKLTPEAIKERAKTTNPKELSLQVQKEFDVFMRELDGKKIDEIDTLYRQLNEFIHFVLFDYYFFLKKFDPALPEDKFSYTPNFSNVNGEYLKDELNDFIVVLNGLSLDANWEKLFAIITAYKNVQPVNAPQWKKHLGLLNDVRRTHILEKIIQHITKNPTYTVEISPFTEKVTDDYLKQIERSIDNTLKDIVEEQKNSQVAVLVQRVFGNTIPSGTKNYNPRSNAAFEKRGLDGYIYADAMNYLKSFLVEYFKSDVRALSDLILVRGQWTQQVLSAEYSESYHNLMHISTKLLEFDEKLSEVSEMGVKFRTLLSRMEREKRSRSAGAKAFE
ncbi:DUF5312 family protein [Treponema vincentii]|uniref:DUF5312 family protein n=1 Tax=Treponema vincentii TaxID=69710 RepID=UPI001E4AE7C9|nr:DUF5312 family protein [Treponema vincentii]